MIQGQIYNPGSKSFSAVKSFFFSPEILATFTDIAKLKCIDVSRMTLQVTPWKFNIHTKNSGLEKDTSFKIWYFWVSGYPYPCSI